MVPRTGTIRFDTKREKNQGTFSSGCSKTARRQRKKKDDSQFPKKERRDERAREEGLKTGRGDGKGL